MKRINWEESMLHKVGVLEGIFSSKNFDATTLKSQMANATESINVLNEVNTRRLNTEEIVKGDITHYRHYFRAPISCGFTWTGRPLPKDVPIKLIFFRAKAEKSVVSIVEQASDKPFSKRSLQLDNIQLVASMITSDYYDRKYSSYRLPKIDFPYMNPIIRREVLTSGLDTFKIKISNGNLPIAMMFGLMDNSSWDGSIRESAVNFKTQNLESVDVKIDSRSLSGYPIRNHGTASIDFWRKYMTECNFLENNYSSGGLSLSDYQMYNFIICENFKRKKLYSGHLTLHLKFKTALSNTIQLVLMPITQKKLNFDENLNVTVSDMNVEAADEVNEELES